MERRGINMIMYTCSIGLRNHFKGEPFYASDKYCQGYRVPFSVDPIYLKKTNSRSLIATHIVNPNANIKRANIKL